MRTLAFLLGTLALAGTIFLGFNWFSARKNMRIARADAAKFAEQATSWRETDEMETRHLASDVDNDDMEVRNADLDIQIADLRGGRGIAAARMKRRLAEGKLLGDKLMQDLNNDTHAMLGPTPHALEPEEREHASISSLKVWSAINERDERLAYALAALWVAFGFAAALAGKKTHAVAPSPG